MGDSITRTAADKARTIDPGRFIDIVAFWLGVGAFRQMKGDKHPQMIAGVRLLRRFQPEMVEGIQKYLLPLTKSPVFARFKAPLAIAMRPSTQLDQAIYQTEILTDLFQLLRSKQTQLHSIFLDSRSAPVAMKVATLASSDSPETILSGLAVLPPASSLQVSRGWLRTAAEEAGVAPTETETVMADSEAARSLGVDLHQVEVQLAQADPMSTYEMDLQEQKQRLLGRIDTIAKTSANPPVVLATAAVAVTQPRDFATNVGRAQRLSPDQERSMMIRGKGLIAAGAGSGKTRVLAAKVVYHMNELGVPAQSIMATSFSRKSAAELLKRIENFGAMFPPGTDSGLGTTHSVASRLMRDYGGGKASRDGLQKFELPSLVRLAMRQVQMEGAGSPPPAPSSMFAETQAGLTAETQAGLTFEEALNQAYQNRGRLGGFLLKFLYGFFNPNDDWYHRNRKNTRNLTDPFGLSEKQQNILLDVFSSTGVTYDPDSDPSLQQQGSGKTAAKKGRDKDKGLREKFPSFSRPVGQWFNLGLHLTEDGTDKGKPFPSGHFKQAITKYKGRLISPSEAWALAKVEDTSLAGLGPSEAAVYAAYEFLKGPSGELDFRGKGDFDDVLIDASKMLLENPKVLRQVQSRFKTVLVDEAQDLNRSQHLMFGLISGFVDPAKVPKVAFVTQFAEVARDDGGMTADTYCFIGDDKQCVSVDALVDTPDGKKPAGSLRVGDQVISNRNGRLVPQTVNHVVPSNWAGGLKVTTESGHSLLMSPNHRLWATSPETEGDQMVVYLMYRTDMGFRVGITNKGKVGSDGDYLNSFDGRAFLEKVERLWVLDICGSREQALLEEYRVSLRYSIPTMVFNGEHRGIDQTRIDTIFKEFGSNGARLLEDRHLSADYPHWMSQSYSKHDRERHTINLIAHSSSNTQVAMEWTGDKFDNALEGLGVRTTKDDHRRLRRWFANYRDALKYASLVSERTGAQVSHRLATPDGPVREIPASGLFVGMSIPVHNESEGGIELDRIVSIETMPGRFVDLDVDDASNFFAGGILTHNSIYEFRGADPDTFIGMSDMVEGGAGFKTEVLKTNYRSGKNIVDAANRLISHNSRQIPMVCDANPSRVSQGGVTRVPFAPVDGADMSEPAMWLATRIEEMMEIGEVDKGYSSFGVGLRSNAESYTYGIELLKKGIPFRSNTNFFSDKNTQAILYWLTLADEGLDGNQERINDAVLNARSAPVSMLGDKFVETVSKLGTGNYIVWLQANWASVYGPRSNHSANVKAYLDNLLLVTSLKAESLSNENLLDRLLGLQGFDGSSVADALIDKVLNDAEAVADLESASPDGEISDDDVRDQAFAPIAPLKSLMGARSNLAEAMNYVRTLQNANSKLAKVDDPNAPDFNQPAVTLNTMHSWKGLEVPNMFIPIVGGRFPRTGSSKEDLAAERRLGYVAITRGENHVYVMDIPTVKIVNQKAVVIRSPFVGEMCIPTSKPTTNKTATEEPSSLPPGMSAHDPDLMDAYLRGEDPLALARQKYLKETQRGAVVAALAKGRLGPTSNSKTIPRIT